MHNTGIRLRSFSLQTLFYMSCIKMVWNIEGKIIFRRKKYAMLTRIFHCRTGATLLNRSLQTFPNNLSRSTSSPVKIKGDICVHCVSEANYILVALSMCCMSFWVFILFFFNFVCGLNRLERPRNRSLFSCTCI